MGQILIHLVRNHRQVKNRKFIFKIPSRIFYNKMQKIINKMQKIINKTQKIINKMQKNNILINMVLINSQNHFFVHN